MTILDEIAEKTRQRIELEKKEISFEDMRRAAEEAAGSGPAGNNAFKAAIAKPGMTFICEVKKASPSKGVIAEDFPYLDIAKDYERSGAGAISVLTEPFWFKGSNEYLREIKSNVSIPVLRKDFTIDPYMIYQAKTLQADAVLLICALLDPVELKEYLETAYSLGLEALVEAHDEREVEHALDAGAQIIGVNNRNLKDFTVDVGNSVRLRSLVPPDRSFVSESGMKTRGDIARLEKAGVNAVLIGETLMRSPDKKKMLDELAGR